ncbi:MAG TPA: hypothetical protein VFO40_13775 [Chthoniobacterales bacterium]|nr:hypothetical protein [Chthoniobacterales bacterium]
MSNRIRFLFLFGINLIQSVTIVCGQITTPIYQYNGGSFTVKTAFNFYTNVVTDALDGTARLQPILKITNSRTDRSMTVSFISENDFISSPEGNVLIGEEIVPGQINPRTNTGAVVVDASNLGSGPLIFSVAGKSELTGRAVASIRNDYGGPFYVWTISPQSITPSLPLYKTPVNNPPPPNPGSGQVSTNIHAVIISGRSDPAKIVTSQNVTVTGGVVALGKDPAPPAQPSSWTAGLRILPDQALLTGTKIPPVTPNLIDVRIVSHEVVGDLIIPGASPSP